MQTYIERDVRQLQNIQNLNLFEMYIGLVAARNGHVLNRAGISRDCGVSQPALKDWESVLYASYIIRLLPPYFNNFGKRLIKTPKIIFSDTAIAAWLTRQPDANALWSGSMGGSFFESWVIMETYKHLSSNGSFSDLYFWRSNDGTEVDLLIQAGGKVHAVEVKMTATPTVNHTAPLKRFAEFSGTLCGQQVVVCCVSEERMLTRNIKALPWQQLTRWLDSLRD